MTSNMTQGASPVYESSPIYENSKPVEKKRNITARFISSVIGAVAAILALVAVSSIVESPGATPFIYGTTLIAIFWGVTTEVSGNLLGLDRVIFTLHQYQIQQAYRKTIEHCIGTTLENVVTSIRTHNYFALQDEVHFHVDEMLHFETLENRRLVFHLSFMVVPRFRTAPQPLHQGAPAHDLPNYLPGSTKTIDPGKKSLVERIIHGILKGSLLGVVSGALASHLFLAIGKTGICLGVMGAKQLIVQNGRLSLPLEMSDKVALKTEFENELRVQLERLERCATDNKVGLWYDMKVGSTTISPGAAHRDDSMATQIFHFSLQPQHRS